MPTAVCSAYTLNPISDDTKSAMFLTFAGTLCIEIVLAVIALVIYCVIGKRGKKANKFNKVNMVNREKTDEEQALGTDNEGG